MKSILMLINKPKLSGENRAQTRANLREFLIYPEKDVRTLVLAHYGKRRKISLFATFQIAIN